MTERKETIIQSCIDFRFTDQMKTYQQESQAHLMSTAGASLNPEEIIGELKDNQEIIEQFINLDHEDCGAYKNFEGDDSNINHQKHMDILKDQISEINNNIEYQSIILRLDPQQKDKHITQATTIILGDPDCLRVAFQRMEEEGLTANHDIIARPFNLKNHDSILNDLKISQTLHRPPSPVEFKVFIFDRDEDNAIILEKKITQTVQDAIIETIIIPEVFEQESVA